MQYVRVSKTRFSDPEFRAAMDQRQLQYGFMSPDEIDKSVADVNAASQTARDLMKRMLAQ